MIIGTTLLHDGSASPTYYSPAFPRGGQAALFSLNVTHVAGSPDLDIVVEHKNADDTSWGTAGQFTTINATGVQSKDITGLKEQIRLAYTFSAGSAGNFMHLIVAAPAWRPYS